MAIVRTHVSKCPRNVLATVNRKIRRISWALRDSLRMMDDEQRSEISRSVWNIYILAHFEAVELLISSLILFVSERPRSLYLILFSAGNRFAKWFNQWPIRVSKNKNE